MGSARFCVRLPRSPQHRKYCNSARSTEAASSSSGAALEGGARPSPRLQRPSCLKRLGFNKHTLHILFRDIDKKGSGFITHRGLIFALHVRLQEAMGPQAQIGEAIAWLGMVAKEVDVDGSKGLMSWKAFLDFFRRAHLFVESHQDVDDNKLDVFKVLEADQAQMKNISMAELGDEHLAMQSEIKTTVGFDGASRFGKNRRAGTPEQEVAASSRLSIMSESPLKYGGSM